MKVPNSELTTKDYAISDHSVDVALVGLLPVTASGYLWVMAGLDTFEIAAVLFVFVGSALAALLMTRRPNHVGLTFGQDDPLATSTAQTASNDAGNLDVLRTLPARRQRLFFLFGFFPVVAIPVLLSIIGSSDPFAPGRMQSLTLVAFVAASLSSSLMFYWTRGSLVSTRSAGPIESAALMPEGGGSLVAGLRTAIALPMIAGLLLMLDVASHGDRKQAEGEARAWLELVVASVAEADAERPLIDRVRDALPAEKFWPIPTQTFEISADGNSGSVLSRSSEGFLSELDRQLVAGSSAGIVDSSFGREVGAFRKLENGAVLIAQISRADLLADLGGLRGGMLLVSVVLVLLSLLLGNAVSGAFSESLASLRATVDRLATGDLRVRDLDPSDDEFGDLSRSLFNLSQSLCGTMQRASAAAAGVEATISGLADSLLGITSTSSGQIQQVEEANRLTVEIGCRVGEATRSADQLTHAIDRSSNSVIELSASGDELKETASVMTAKVDAVSTSLEQMISSVKQVAATTGRLSEASEETSSSMEEMASAMRAVDTAAETTASLSRDVVEKAELGQRKVVQTIEGMEAIREATDVAERVIRGLGARTNEIGGILDVIEDVADETNLLALNAAIIAAQAGDQGKAFSVVADEIKELADRVLASTKEIGGLIRAVQEESENAIGAIEAGSASVMGGVDLSAEAGRTLEEITVASRESGTRITEIVNSVREQTKAASHVVTLMERVRESAEQIGQAGSEQERGNEVVYASALTMREVAVQLRHTTEGQAVGFGRIRENVSGVRGAVEQITDVLREQSDACTQVTGFLEGVAAGTRANEGAAQQVRVAMADLAAQAQELREDVERFRY